MTETGDIVTPKSIKGLKGTVSGVAKTLVELGFTTDEVTRSNMVLIAVENNNVRWWSDGTTPTATDGIPVNSGESLEIYGWYNLLALKIIAQSGTATLQMMLAR